MPVPSRRPLLRRTEFSPSRLSVLAEYRCDALSGTTLRDYSGRGNHGTVTGGVWADGGLRASGTGAANASTPIPYNQVRGIACCFDPTAVTSGQVVVCGSSSDVGAVNLKMAGLSGVSAIASGSLYPMMAGGGGNIVGADINTSAWPTTLVVSMEAASRMWLHGVEPLFYDAHADYLAAGQSYPGNLQLFNLIGNQSVPTLWYSVIVLGAPVGGAMALSLHRYMLGRQGKRRARFHSVGGPARLTKTLLVRSGNSYVGLMATSYPGLATPLDIVSSATVGAPAATVALKSFQATTPLYRPNAPANVALIWPTPNSTDLQSIYDTAKSVCTQWRQKGFRTIVLGPTSASGYDPTKAAVSALFKDPATGATSFADVYIDFSDVPEIFADGAYASTTYFLDGLHMTPLSYANWIDARVQAAIIGLIPPHASFSVSAATVVPGGTVTCTQTSQGTVTGSAWTAVGQATGTTYTSTATSPVFTLAVQDTYAITLTATGPNGSSRATRTVTADPSAAILALNPHVWIDASPGYLWQDTARTVPAVDGSAVASAEDRSGNGRHATQAVAGKRPLFVASGTRCLRFTSAEGRVLAFGDVFSGLTAGEILIVMKQGPTFATLSLVYEFGSGGGGDLYTFGTGIYDGFASTTRHDGFNSQAGVSVVLTDPNLINVQSSSDGWSYWINGVLKFSTATNTVGWSTTPGIGGRPSDGGGGDIDICEAIVFPVVLTAPQRGSVAAYLKPKWGTP